MPSPRRNPNPLGRPRNATPSALSSRQIRRRDERAAKVEDVYKCIQENFDSFGEFLEEFLTNETPEIKNKAGKFYCFHGDRVMNIMLEDSRAGRKSETWPSLVSWVEKSVDREYSKVLSQKRNSSILRYAKRVSSSTASYASPQLHDFQKLLIEQCPLTWHILNTLGATCLDSDDSTLALMPITAAMVLMYSRSQQANTFQVLLSVFFYAHRTQKRAMEALHCLGLTMDYSWTTKILRDLAESNISRLQGRAAEIPHMLSMDNINRQLGVRNHSLTSKSFIDNSTSGFAVNIRCLPNVLEGHKAIPRSWWKPGERKNLTSVSMAPSAAAVKYMYKSNKSHLMDILQEYTGGKMDRKKYFPTAKVRKLSTTEAFEVFSFAVMDVEQGSVDGNRESLKRATLRVSICQTFLCQEDLIDIIMLVSGDQLTMDRYRSLRALHDTDVLGEQFNWVLPIMGLFHLTMNYLKMFLKNHLGNVSDPSSLRACNVILGRPRINDKLADFWSVMDLTNDCLDAFVLSLMLVETGIIDIHELTKQMKDSVGDDGKLVEDPVIDFVALIERIHDKYLKFTSVSDLREQEDEQRDRVYENAILLLRHSLQFRDFYDATRGGDVGRIAHMLEIWPAEFIGANQHRYANELLSHQCGVKAEYDPELTKLIMDNILINPGHKNGHFLSIDEYMEEVVRHIKLIFNPGGAQQAESFARDIIGHVIVTLIGIKKELRMGIMGREFGGHHTRAKKPADIASVMDHLRRKGVFQFTAGRGTGEISHSPVKDWMQNGLKRLSDGKYWDQFVKRTTKRGAAMLDVEALEDEELAMMEFPDYD
ncbi:hypothetical protein EDC01DRAFT_632698 [Geopyxis carbonaria]|nr:hypothetical protein EDC01DRAFT_632698 [Geopyxis carbonaria]